MRRGASVALLTVLLGGGVCPRSAAQGFNVRHDLFGWGHTSSAFAFEQSAASDIIVFSNNDYVDTVTNMYWGSIAGLSRFSQSGQFLGQDTVFDPQRTSFVGWSNCSTMLPDGRIVVSGAFQNADTTWAELYWFAPDGTLLNRVEFPSPTARTWTAYQHKNTPDGGFIVVGVAGVNSQQDNLLFKTDSLGNLEWWQTYGHPTRMDGAVSVDHAPGGGYYAGGTYPVTSVLRVQWVMRTDGLGNIIWNRYFGGAVQDAFSAHVTTTADGNVVFASGEISEDLNYHRAQLCKTDTAGNELWNRKYGPGQYGTGLYVVQEVAPFGDLIACGRHTVNGMLHSAGILLRTNSNGDSLWMYEYLYYDSLMSDGEGVFRDVQSALDGGFVVVGDVGGSLSGNTPSGLSVDVWVVKVDSMGCIVPGCNDIPTGITTQITNLKDALVVYPNPAHGSTTVRVTLPAGSPWANDMRLRMVNAQGQEVLVQKAVLGENRVPLQGLAAGICYVHLTSGTTWLGGTKLIIE